MADALMPELMIDREFKDLIRPLLKDEYRQLEDNLAADGCREPIITWKGIIVDGHNRYEICKRRGFPFQVSEKYFESREEVIIWICSNQLGRRSISEETKKYLIGKRYEAEKIINGKRNAHGWNQYRGQEKEFQVDDKVINRNPKEDKIRTSVRLGEEYHLAHATVEKYGAYSRAVDKIAEKEPDMLPKILSGRYKISHDNVVAISEMSDDDIQDFSDKMNSVRKNNGVITFCAARSQLSKMSSAAHTPLVTAIKNMPDFDPDAEITGLTLTIPSWASSIKRTRCSTNLAMTSLTARMKLENALCDLQITIDEMLQAIKE